MNFTDYIFSPFVFMVIILYFLIPLKYRWITLLFASVIYFATWGIDMLPFAIIATFIAWVITNIIERWNLKFDEVIKPDEAIDQKTKKIIQKSLKTRCKYLLWVGVALILGVLVYVKIQRLIFNIPLLTDGVENFHFITILGVSYYTMSLIGYMADVYWRKDKAEKNICKLLLFTLYFPKIVEGPISKHRNIKEQLYNGNTFDYQRFCFGLQRMLWGYFKKMVIADRLILFVNPVFTNYLSYHGSVLLFAAVLSAFQMYCDFSGCMDIALGLSEIFGIKLEENFRRPFFAKSVPEFWTRWHMSLSSWFKDYIYMPIVISPKLIKISGKLKKIFGKRVAKNFATIVPVVVVWTITGLWHGTGWNYIAWGIYWAILFVLSTVLGPEIKKLTKLLHINTETKDFQIFRQLRTFGLFVICRIIVAPADLSVTKEIIRRIVFNFGPWQLLDGTIFTVGLDEANFTVAIYALLILLLISIKQEHGVSIREKISELSIVGRWFVYLVGIFVVLIFGIYGPGYDMSTFIYMNF